MFASEGNVGGFQPVDPEQWQSQFHIGLWMTGEVHEPQAPYASQEAVWSVGTSQSRARMPQHSLIRSIIGIDKQLRAFQPGKQQPSSERLSRNLAELEQSALASQLVPCTIALAALQIGPQARVAWTTWTVYKVLNPWEGRHRRTVCEAEVLVYTLW